MDSYKLRNENLQTKLETREKFVLSSILKLWYVDFCTKFLTYKRWYLLRYTQCSQPVNYNTEISILQHHLPEIKQCLMNTSQNIALPNVSKTYENPASKKCIIFLI